MKLQFCSGSSTSSIAALGSPWKLAPPTLSISSAELETRQSQAQNLSFRLSGMIFWMHREGEGEAGIGCSAGGLTGSSIGKDQWPCHFNAADHSSATADPCTDEPVHLLSREAEKQTKQTKRMHSPRRMTGLDTPTFLSALTITPGIAAT